MAVTELKVQVGKLRLLALVERDQSEVVLLAPASQLQSAAVAAAVMAVVAVEPED